MIIIIIIIHSWWHVICQWKHIKIWINWIAGADEEDCQWRYAWLYKNVLSCFLKEPKDCETSVKWTGRAFQTDGATWRKARLAKLVLIDSMPAKSSPIDSIPTSIIKSCSGIFSILITLLATLSFNQGSFPASYKMASVTPLLKKKDLDPHNPASFRPISNLYTISKVLERLFLSRIGPHVESSQNFNRFQSAYRRGFSTETAILRMLNDVYSAADDRRDRW